MPHNNIAIFVPHLGCPNMCSFCNQRSISGSEKAPSFTEVRAICEQASEQIKDKSDTEIAFFGGSFTAIEPSYMAGLLKTANEFVGEGKFSGIRISTRPDCISEEILSILKLYRVTAIELGVQSMSDEVLSENDRGHTSEDVRNAVTLIKKNEFELGLQMMVGLYKSSVELDTYTAQELIKLKPKTVRIYPVAVLKGTRLEELFIRKEYIPPELKAAVRQCADLLKLFQSNGIDVIRLGLHASELVESQLVGGLYHPAFRELCESLIFRDLIEAEVGDKQDSFTVEVSMKAISKAIGQKKSNIDYFLGKGIKIKIIPSSELTGYNIKVTEDV